jgi:NitT/TauT family transport system ATP-binding protein
MENMVHVRLDRVSKVFGSGAEAIEAIRDVSFDVERGGFVSVLGPSGCGKSTLLMMVGGLLPPSRGRVEIGGLPVTAPRRDTAVLFQTPVLFPWRTVLQNVMFPVEVLRLDREAYRAKALALLETTGLLEFTHRLPEELSGGMTQRVAICRALVHDPELLLMDEPFSALDPLTREDMNLELLRIWDRFKKTVVFVTHSIREAVFLSDCVILLSPRPSQIAATVTIDLPRPRSLDVQESEPFNRYCGQLRKAMGR